ncbi:MAG: hypothetical protein EPO08_20710 [Rhodospirillaceae bacterium]|nr:MAG: hypothetical protein EPO08_20710 [Rhodospirillaceae bacterium]
MPGSPPSDSLSEIRTAKAAMETTILQAVNAFEVKAGLLVTGIVVSHNGAVLISCTAAVALVL